MSEGPLSGNCQFCGAELQRASASGYSTHLCPTCHAPQPLRADEDYFTLLGAPKKFRQDSARLQKKFYELSRVLHPDRFSTAERVEWQQLSLQRMSEINQAYQTLRKPEALLEYVLGTPENQAPSSPAKTAPPLEYAEEWFEIQDLVQEDPQSAMKRLEVLKHQLTASSQRFGEMRQREEDKFDRGETVPALEALRKIKQDAAYIQSMKRDIDRLEAKLRGSS